MDNSRKTLRLYIRGMAFFLLSLMYNHLAAQSKKTSLSQLIKPGITKFVTKDKKDLFNTRWVFIENIGQYGEEMMGHQSMGKIQFGYEGMDMPVLLTSKGIILMHRKVQPGQDKDAEPEEVIKNAKVTDKVITMQWINADPDPEIITEEKQTAYHTYGLIQKKAFAYKRITYKELYPGIDVVYSFSNGNIPGFEYSILVKPGADLGLVKIKLGGDIKNIAQDIETLLLSSEIETISMTNPIAFYEDAKTTKVSTKFIIKGNELTFKTNNYDHSRTLVIDPFISGTGNLTGNNAGIAKDIDYDYAGNVYVSGGGNIQIHQLLKYDSNGILQWIFSGSIAIPFWEFGSYYGGWVVEKTSGNIYIGQGGKFSGTQTIRLNTSGIYDNYITSVNSLVNENWKMTWSCSGNSPQLYIGGGSTVSNLTIGIISPPASTITFQNITGIPYTGPPANIGAGQDISDLLIDPVTNSLYSIFGSGGGVGLANKIYKLQYPYTPSDKDWDIPTGFNSLSEAKNRPYLNSDLGGINDNSANLLALNSHFLFYWDGRFLKAFDKNTGAAISSPVTYTLLLPLYCGGIVADECDNVYIGFNTGLIKVFHFTVAGGFDDSPPDIGANPSLAPVYDLAYDDGKHLLYACGSGFVGSYDVSGYCAATVYNLSVLPDCSSLSAIATITPNPSPGWIITYVLYSGATQIASNTTGVFTGLTLGASYTINAFVNQACGGPQLTTGFTLLNCPLGISATYSNASCGLSNGSITVTGANGTVPYQYSIDGINFQSAATFLNLAPGNYTITIKDALGLTAITNRITIVDMPAPVLTATATNVTCNNTNNGTITATRTGGTSPFQYSIDGINFQISNIFTGLAPNNYSVIIKDGNNCSDTFQITITGSLGITAISTPTSCTINTGTIVATANAGTAPYQYSIDNINYQAANSFTGLAANSYTAYIKDATGCVVSFPVTVSLTNTVIVSAGNNINICQGEKKQLTATSNGTTFLWTPSAGLSDPTILNPDASPIITTIYTITASDGICTRTSSVTVFVDPLPVANAGKDSTICFGKSIQLNGTGGTNYLWSPSTYLNNPAISNPTVIMPIAGLISYSLKVTDANGCQSANTSSINITVTTAPALFAGYDTTVAINQPIQLNALDINNTGFVNYLWNPTYGLNNPAISNPIAVLDRDIIYSIIASTANGCQGIDDIRIKVYKGPDIYVPNSFTPNGDGLNDILKAIPIGMKEFRYFNIYNRYGQLVFTTKNAGTGWDGKLNAKIQNTGGFAWMAEAVDYKGNIVQRKGTVILIR